MAERDYAATPISDSLGLKEIIRDLSADLADLRAGTITVHDAMARAAIAKQIFNGVRLYMVGARVILPPPDQPKLASKDQP